jgi:hypothetical protein
MALEDTYFRARCGHASCLECAKILRGRRLRPAACPLCGREDFFFVPSIGSPTIPPQTGGLVPESRSGGDLAGRCKPSLDKRSSQALDELWQREGAPRSAVGTPTLVAAASSDVPDAEVCLGLSLDEGDPEVPGKRIATTATLARRVSAPESAASSSMPREGRIGGDVARAWVPRNKSYGFDSVDLAGGITGLHSSAE